MLVREPRRFTGQTVKSDERHFLSDHLADPDFPGAIIWRNAFGHNEDLMRRLGETGKPIVYVDTPPPANVRGDYVGSANALAARTCVEHLLGLGHTRIVFVADTLVPETVQDRVRGYRRAMKTGGVEDLSLVIEACEEEAPSPHHPSLAGPYARSVPAGSYFCDLAERALRRILSMDPMPTAIFACHDVLASGIHALLCGSGIRVPEEISLIGFDWIADTERSFPDDLTTAAQAFEGFGTHAANLILDRASGEMSPDSRHVMLDAPLIERSSTAPRLSMPVFESARPFQGEVALSIP
jgi:LacI family transcriptional regulator